MCLEIDLRSLQTYKKIPDLLWEGWITMGTFQRKPQDILSSHPNLIFFWKPLSDRKEKTFTYQVFTVILHNSKPHAKHQAGQSNIWAMINGVMHTSLYCSINGIRQAFSLNRIKAKFPANTWELRRLSHSFRLLNKYDICN